MATFTSAPFVAFLLLLVQTSASEDTEEIKAKPKDNVTLHCRGPRHAAIIILEWTRPDLEADEYVFFYQDGYSHDQNLHPSFRGRVQLRDPHMKDGNVSLILKNVTINDTGMYTCRVSVKSKGLELINTINLTVEDSGHTAGNTWTEGDKDEGDKDGGKKEERNHGLTVGLPVAGLVVAVIVGFVIYKQRRQHPDQQAHYRAAVSQQD